MVPEATRCGARRQPHTVPFLPLMMHNPPDAEQHDRPTNMYFSGAHSDLLKGELSLFVLGWFVGHLDAVGGVKINHQELEKIFPDYGGSSHLAWKTCCKAQARQSFKGPFLAAGYCTRVPGELHHPDFTVSKSIQAFRRETTGLRFGTTRLPSIIILPSTLMALPGPETMQLRWPVRPHGGPQSQERGTTSWVGGGTLGILTCRTRP